MNKDIRWDNNSKIILITFFSALYFYAPVGTLYLQSRGLNFLQINSIWAAIVGTMFFAEVPTGLIADKIGRKYSIIIALALQLLGEVLYIFAHSYLAFILIAIVGGIGFSFASGCVEALVYDSLKVDGKESEMKRVSGLMVSAGELARMSAPLAAALLITGVELSKFILLIVMTCVSVAIALLVSLTLREPKLPYDHPETSPLQLLKDGIQLLRSNQSLQRIVLLSLLATPFVNYLTNFYQPYFLQSHVPTIWLGLALSLASLLALLASKYAYLFERRLGTKNAALIATLLPGLLYLLMAFVFHPVVSVVLFCFAYGSTSIQGPLFADYRNVHIESHNRATVLSLISMLSGFYVAVMGLIIGRIGDYSIPAAFVFMGIIVVLSALFFRIDEKHTQAI
jgi:MFS family permease